MSRNNQFPTNSGLLNFSSFPPDSSENFPRILGKSSDLIIADGRSPDIALLLQKPSCPVVLLNAEQDPLVQITEILANSAVSRLHIVAHGADGSLLLGGRVLNRAELLDAAELLQQWSVQNIALWVCQVGADSQMLRTFSDLTGAAVHASDDYLGWHNGRHQWDLQLSAAPQNAEFSIPQLPIERAHANQWHHHLGAITFSNVYAINTDTTPASKEQNDHDFDPTSLGSATAIEGEVSDSISGNDALVKLTINGVDHYGWISRQIKSQGEAKAYYFWKDDSFTDFDSAIADGNKDEDDDDSDNSGFILVLDQSYFDDLEVSNGLKSVKSSSDPIDFNFTEGESPSLSINDISVNESDGTAVFTVTRAGTTLGTTTVDYSTNDVSATAGSDYTAKTGSLSFAPGEISKTISISLSDDQISEGNETFTVSLSNIADTFHSNPILSDASGAATIADDDSTGLVLGNTSLTTSEGGSYGGFTIKLPSQPTADVTVTITGLDSSEGSLSNTTFTFTPDNWDTEQTAFVTGVNDDLDDGDIEYTLTATTSSADANYSGDNAQTGTVTVTNQDNDAAPSLSINDVTVDEDAGTASFTVTRSGATGGTTTVDYATADGSATSGSDFTTQNGSLSFAPGETSKTVTVELLDDQLVEGSENFTVSLSNVADNSSDNEAISDATGSATISDNDTAGLVLGSSTITTSEDGTSADFTVKLSSKPTANVTVTLTGLDGTEGSLSSSTLTFTPDNWDSVQTVTVTGLDDSIDDGNANYTLTATSSSSDANYTGDNARTGTVAVVNQDNDLAPTLSINDISVDEDAGTASFTVTRAGATGGTTTVNFATADGSATAGDDYVGQTGSLSFAPGETSKTIAVELLDDQKVEGIENFTVALSNISDSTSNGETIADASGSAAISDNDSAGLILGNTTISTSENGSSADFSVRLSSQPAANVTVTLTGLDGTEGSLSSTTLTFSPSNWDSAQTITVTGLDDNVDDGDINYTLTATTSSSDATYDGVNAASAVVSITNQDNETAPVLSINDVTVDEDSGTASFTVTRAGATGGTTTVNYATADGSATAGEDYVGQTGSVSFGVGETSKTITIDLVDDNGVEAAESFTVTLSDINDSDSNNASISDASGTATINDNDTAGLVLGSSSITTSEDGTSADLTVKLSSKPTANVTVTLTGLDATEGSLSSNTLTFTPDNWNSVQTITVTGLNDGLNDDDVDYTLTAATDSSDANYGGSNVQTQTVSVTNTDNDDAPALSIADASVNEADGSVTLTVTRAGATGGTTTVDYVTNNGTAGAGSDYVTQDGSLTFSPGETSVTITIPIVNDQIAEGLEAFTVNLSNSADSNSDTVVLTDASATVSVSDNDTAGLVLGSSSLTTSEDGTSADFTVKLSSKPTANVTVTLTGLDGTEGSLSSSTLTFTPDNWDSVQTVTVTGLDDNIDDGNANYTLTATSSSLDTQYNGDNARTATVTVVNQDDDLAPTLSINDISVDEDAGTASFTVTRAGATGGTTTVNYATADGSATAGDDYVGQTGSLSFAPGETSKTITVELLDNQVFEDSETFTVALSNIADSSSNNEAITDASGTATITDDDNAALIISKSALATTEEGASDSFTVRLSSKPSADVTVTLTGLDATEGLLSSTTLTFTPDNWDSAQNITVTGLNDDLDDGDVSYTLTATSSSADTNYGGTNAPSSTISVSNQDNDTAPVLSINDVTVDEDSGTASFTVTRAGATGGTTTVNYATADGSATAGEDYLGQTGSVSFGVGETSKTITIDLVNDDGVEPTESFTVTLNSVTDSASNNASISDASGTATINDNDTAGLVLGSSSITTSEDGTSADLTVKLSSKPTANVTVTLTGLDATEGSLSSNTLTFTPDNWNSVQTITVTGLNDGLNDDDVDYTLTAATDSSDANYGGSNVQTQTVSVTNTDNDDAPALSIADASVNEADGSVTLTVTRAGATGGTTTVDYVTNNGTAGAGSDYVTQDGSLTFSPGETSVTITIPIVNDQIAEGLEAFTVNLSNSADSNSDTVVLTDASATVSVSDNDTAGLVLGSSSLTTSEDGTSADFTVKLSSKPTANVTVTLTGLDGTEGSLSSSTLTFTPDNWDSVQTVTVTGLDDSIDDGNANYTLTATSSSLDANYTGDNARTGTVTVVNQDDDLAPTLSINNIAVDEDAGTATFTVTRAGATGGTTTVDFDTVDGSATAGDDYVGQTGSLSFAPGETSKTITVELLDNEVFEDSETFTVALSNIADSSSNNEAITDASGTATITDDDNAALIISKSALATTEEGASDSFTVRLSSKPSADVTVTLTGLDATEGLLSSTTLTFTPDNWDSAQNITVTGLNDDLDDGDVSYTLTATSSSADTNYSGTNAPSSTISVSNQDNDTAPVLSINDVTVDESASTASFTVTRAGATGGTTTVNYATADGSATAGEDYLGQTGSVSFGVGETSKTITIDLVNDDGVEPTESFTVTLNSVTDSASNNASISDASGTATINDNDTAGLVLGSSSITTSEDGTSADFTVKLSSKPTANVTVTLTGLDATEGTLSSNTLTFTPDNWNSVQTITVTGLNDGLNDDDVDYTLTAATDSSDANYGGSNVQTQTVSVTNTDNDDAPALSIADASVNEADGSVTLTVTRAGATGGTTTVDYVTNNGTAGAGSDYVTQDGSLTFSPGETSVTITIPIVNDQIAEGLEAFTVNLSNSADSNSDTVVLSDASATVSVSDNDTAGLVLGSSSLTTSEDGTSADFTVKLSSKPTANVTVTLTGLDGTEGSLSSSTLTFTPDNWDSVQTVTVTGLDDNIDDGDANYTLTATSSSSDPNYTGDNAKTGTVTVVNQDDDLAPALSINNIAVDEDAGTAVFTVTRAGATGGTTTVDFATVDGSATAGDDYVGQTGSLSFAPGETSNTITVELINNQIAEGSEHFNVSLSGITDDASSNPVISNSNGSATIADDDNAGLIISKNTLATTEEGATDSFTVKLSSQPTANVTVTLTGLDVTEGSLSDTTLTFTPDNWNSVQNITVTGLDDSIDDGNSSYTLTATSGSSDANYNAKTGTVTVTNQDDDLAPTVSINDVSVDEDAGTATFTVTRSGATGGATSLKYATSDGSATAGSDYIGKNGSLEFASGETSKTITIDLVDDNGVEAAENFTVTLSDISDSDSSNASISDASGTATISDNDTAGLVLGSSAITTSEDGSSADFTVKLSSKPTANVTVTLTGLDATEGSLSSNTLTFTPDNWDSVQTITVTGLNDGLNDDDVDYTLTAATDSSDANYGGSNAQTQTVSVTNTDNDDVPALSIADASVNEADGSVTLTVTRAGATGGTTTVDYATSNGSAEANGDYISQSGILTFGPGETTATVTISIVDDRIVDGLENFTVNLSNATDSGSSTVALTDAAATVNISDNDTAGLVLSANSLETAEDGSSGSFNVKLASQPIANVVVTLTGLDATEGSLSSSTLTFTPENWDNAQTVTVTGVNDSLDDGDISYTLTATTSSNDGNYTGDNAKTGTVTIVNEDNDSAPSIRINDISVNEDSGTAVFTVTRDGANGGTTTVGFSTADGSATAGDDYTSNSGNLSFGPGETSKTISVNLLDDSVSEGNETFTVELDNVADSSSDGESIADGSGVATINDNDSTGLILGNTTLSTSEDGTSGSFTAKLSSQPTADVIVTFSGLDATEGSLSTNTLTFTADNWNNEQTITVAGVNDAVNDGNISYTLNAATSSSDANYGGANVKTGTVTVTNIDDDEQPQLSISDASVNEASGSVEVTITRSGATGGTTTVDYATSNGSALAGSDYTAQNDSITFEPGQTSKTISIAITDDQIEDGVENFTVNLSNGSDTGSDTVSLSNATATITINDDDVTGLIVSNTSINTGEDLSSGSFTIKLSSQPTADVAVSLTGLDSTEGKLSSNTLTFTPENWNNAQTVTVTGVDDSIDDGDINYTLIATTNSGGDANYHGDNGHTQTISVTNTDNDSAPLVSINDVITDEDSNSVEFTITREGATGGTTTLNYTTANGSATAGSDYVAENGSISFAPGETSKTVSIELLSDQLSEGTETFTLNLSDIEDSSSANESFIDNNGTATLNDNDSTGMVLTGTSLTTSEAGTTGDFTVKLSSQPIANVTVTLSGLDNSEGSLSTNTLTFTPQNWNSAQTVTVTGVDDTLNDGDISYTLNAVTSSTDANYNGDNAKTGTVTVTNSDDDDAPSLSVADVTVDEDAGQVTLTVTRAGATGGTTTVDYATANGTATGGSDFTAQNGSLSFAPGESSKTITLAISNDQIQEGLENFTVNLSNAADESSDTVTLSKASATVNINDNDSAGLVLGNTTLTTSETGTTADFTVKLSSQPTANVIVTLTGLDATEGSLSSNTLTFTPENWNSTQTVTVTGINDNLDDGNISYTLTATTSSSDSNFNGDNAHSGTITISNQDDDAAPSVSISNDVTVDEDAGTVEFTVTRAGATGGTTTVDFTTQDGSAKAGSDYTGNNGSLSFAPAETSKTISVSLNDDKISEATETFTVNLSNVDDSDSDNVSIGDSSATVSITDNDATGLIISSNSLETTENGTTGSFTLKLASKPLADVTVSLSGLDSTEGNLSSSVLTFTPDNWDSAQTVTVTGVSDKLDDGDISYTLTATTSSGGDPKYHGDNAHTQTVSVTNSDIDEAPSLSVNDTTVNEALGTMEFTITRAGATGGTTTVDYATADGTAIAGQDYTFRNGSLSFAPGETSKTVTITVLNDQISESNETFTLGLSNIADSSSNNESITDGTGIGTITDNDSAGMVISKSSLTTFENENSANFTIKLTSQPTADVTVTLSGLDSSEGTLGSNTLTFTSSNWNVLQTVKVTGVDDTLNDGDISYTLNAVTSSADANYNGDNAKTGTVTVTNTDDDDSPSLSIADVTVDEDTGQVALTVTRAGATGGTTTVDYATANGTATGGSDFTAQNGSLSFAPGETSKTITLAINNDNIQEGLENFTVNLSNAADESSDTVTLSDASATVSINDNDSAGLVLGNTTLTTSETGTTADFTVKLSSQPTANVLVTLTGLDATEGSLSSNTLTFTPENWNSTQTVTVTGLNDNLDDGDISYTLTATTSSSDGNFNGDNAHSGTITISNQDDDAAPSVSISNDVTVNEDAGTVEFTVTRAGATGGTTTVDFTTTDGSAKAGSDYTGNNGSLSFAPAETSKTISVSLNDDKISEATETFTVNLSNVDDSDSDNVSIGDSSATVSITDNDATGLIISSNSLETTENGTTGSFTLKLASKPLADVTVSLSGLDSTEGNLSSSVLTFTPDNWDSAQTVTVTGVSDKLDDGDISYTLTATTSSGGDPKYHGDNAHTQTVSVTNSDIDEAPSLSVNDATVNEALGTMEFTITRAGATGGTTTVDYATADGTAIAGQDYTSRNGSLSFAPGETSKTVTVTVLNDQISESNETFTLGLSNIADSSSNNESITDGTGIGTITDNDGAGLVLGSTTITTSETGTTGEFTVKLSSQPVANVTVTLSGLDSSEGSLSANTLTFTPQNWSSAQTVTVTGVNDTLNDGDISYTLNAVTSSTDANYNGDNAKTGTVTVTNTDDDAAPSLSIADVTVNEKDGEAVLTVTRTGATGGTTTVDYGTSDGSAKGGSDFTAKNGTLSFAPGETSKTITLDISNDQIQETLEDFTVNLSNAADESSDTVTLSDASAKVSINDDDSAGLLISKTSLSTTEKLTSDSFTIKLSSKPTANVSVSLTGLDSSEGQLSSNTLTFTPDNWDSAQTVTVTGVNDTLDDGDITYTLTATTTSSDPNFSGDNAHTGAITISNQDDDTAPSLSIADVSVNESAGTVEFTVTRAGSTGGTTTVDFTTKDGSAKAGSDYTAKNGSLSFAPDETSKTISVSLNDDKISEATETFTVDLSNVADSASKNPTISDNSATASISDNDAAGLLISSNTLETRENGTTGSFTLKLASKPLADVTVSLSGLDTTEGKLSSSVLTFTPENWDSAQTVTVTGISDKLDDDDISYTLTATSSSGGDPRYHGSNAHTKTISVTNRDIDEAPSLSVNDVSVNEALGTAVFTITRAGATGGTTTLDYATANGSATAGQDYTAKNGSLSFAPGETSKTVSVNILNDQISESNETFTLGLSNIADSTSKNEKITDNTGVATITDNDSAGLELGKSSIKTGENGSSANFTVRLTSKPTSPVTVTLSGLDSSEGSLSSNTLTFTSDNWAVNQTVKVTGVDDNFRDGDISYTLTARTSSSDPNYSGANVKSGSVAVTNSDNDKDPELSISDAAVNEKDGTVVLTVTREGATGGTTTVDFSTSDGSAKNGTDFGTQSGTVSFAPGETSKSITIQVIDDKLAESLENFTVNLSNASDSQSKAVTLTDASATVSINDDEAATSLRFGTTEASVNEEDGSLELNVIREGALGGTTTVSYSMAGGSATVADDFTPSSNTLTFAPGESSKTITIPIADDSLLEGDESFTVNLSGAADSGGKSVTLTNSSSLVSIKDDERLLNLEISGATISEASGIARVVVTRTGDLDASVSVNYSTADGSALAGQDYKSAAGVIKFKKGEASKTISIALTNDAVQETIEQFLVQLQNAVDGKGKPVTINVSSAQVAIEDNDSAGIVLSRTSLTTSESGTSADFTVQLASQPAEPVTIDLSGIDSSEGTLSSQTLVFTTADWNQAQTISVTGVADNLDDGDVIYSLNLTANSQDAFYNSLSESVSVVNHDVEAQYVESISDAFAEEGTDSSIVYQVTLNATTTSARQFGMVVGGDVLDTDVGTPTFSNGVTLDPFTFNVLVPEGVSSFAVTVPVLDDPFVEETETLTLSIGGKEATGFIADEDVRPDTLLITDVTETQTDPTPFDLLTGDTTQYITVEGKPEHTIKLYTEAGDLIPESGYTVNETAEGIYEIDATGITLLAGNYYLTQSDEFNESLPSNTFTVDSTPELLDHTPARSLLPEGGMTGRLAVMDQNRVNLTSLQFTDPPENWFDADGEPAVFGISGVTPIDGIAKVTLASGSTFTLNVINGDYTYIPAVSAVTDVFPLTVRDPGGKGGNLNLSFEARDLLDRDGVPQLTEDALSAQFTGAEKDSNNDGQDDATQNSVSTLAWSKKSNFDAAISGRIEEVDPTSIINIVAHEDGSSDTASGISQLINISVLSTDSETDENALDTKGLEGLEAPWDPLAFSVEPLQSLGLIDTDTGREGLQIRMTIDVSSAKIQEGGFDGYMKYISAETIQAASDAGVDLITFDGEALVSSEQAGWYDFLQRSPGGDGARYIVKDGFITQIELIITDNAFGDVDFTVGRVTDPGLPVLKPDVTPPKVLLSNIEVAQIHEFVAENTNDGIQLTSNESVVWSIKEEGDHGQFTISSSGELRFVQSPDYEMPADSNASNDYQLVVSATDKKGNETLIPTMVSVTNVQEASPVYAGELNRNDHLLSGDEGNVMTSAIDGQARVEFFSYAEQIQGTVPLKAFVNTITGDYFYAPEGTAFPYDCYIPTDSVGLGFVPGAGQGAFDVHLFINSSGVTQIMGQETFHQLGLNEAGYVDMGAIFASPESLDTSAEITPLELVGIADQDPIVTF